MRDGRYGCVSTTGAERMPVMLRIRLSVDVKCPRHPRRNYEVKPAGCGICQAIVAALDLANRATRELRGASRLGADLRWKNVRRVRLESSADAVASVPWT